MSISPFFFSAIETHLLQEDLGKTIQTQKNKLHRSFDDQDIEGLRKSEFSAVFEDRDAFRAKGSTRSKQHRNFLSFWGSTLHSRGLRFLDINPRCPAALRENWEKPFEIVGALRSWVPPAYLHLPPYTCTCLFFDPHLYTHYYIYLSICLSVCLSICLSACLSGCLPACLCLSVCLSLCLSIYLYGPAALHLQIFMW